MYLINILSISGIFGKSIGELDLLPPPPPFPKIEEEVGSTEKIRKGKDKQNREAERLREREEKRRQRELKLKKKKNNGLMEKGGGKAREKTFDFFNKLGFVKTEEEKKELERQKQEYKKLKIIAKKMGEGKKRKQRELPLMKKEDERHLDKELEDIEKIILVPMQEKKIETADTEFEIPEFTFGEKIEKPHEVIKAEEEIKKAIEGIKHTEKKRPSLIKGLFKKRRYVAEKVERPEVMPRIEVNPDSIELIEEKMHKARLALMDFKFVEAKRIYVEIMSKYNSLDQEKKAKVHQDITDLYYERKSAEKFAK